MEDPRRTHRELCLLLDRLRSDLASARRKALDLGNFRLAQALGRLRGEIVRCLELAHRPDRPDSD